MPNHKILLLAGLAAMAVAGATAEAAAAPAKASTTVNVRSGPGTTYAIVDALFTGENVDVGQCQAGWCYVTHEGNDGWVSAQFLVAPGPQNPGPFPPNNGGPRPFPGNGGGNPFPPNGNPGPFPPNNGGSGPRPFPGDEDYAPPPPSQQPRPIPGPQPAPPPQQVGPGFNFGFNFGNGAFSFGVGQTPAPRSPAACFYDGADYTGGGFCVVAGDYYSSLGNFNNRISSVRVFNGATATICSDNNLYGTCQSIGSSKSQLGVLNNQVSSVEVD